MYECCLGRYRLTSFCQVVFPEVSREEHTKLNSSTRCGLGELVQVELGSVLRLKVSHVYFTSSKQSSSCGWLRNLNKLNAVCLGFEFWQPVCTLSVHNGVGLVSLPLFYLIGTCRHDAVSNPVSTFFIKSLLG